MPDSTIGSGRPAWLSQYPSGVPAEIDMASLPSAADILVRAAARWPDRPAFSQFGATLSYAALDALSARFAAFLKCDLGLGVGDRIALMMPNALAFPIVLTACFRAGITLVNVNPLYTPAELAKLIADAAPQAVVAHELAMPTVERALETAPVPAVIVAGFADRLPDATAGAAPPAPGTSGPIRFAEALARHPPADFRPPALDHETMAFLQYTGGTTGQPKGAILTHGNVVAETLALEAWFAPLIRPGEERTLIALPLYHVAALLCQCVSSINNGSHCCLIANPRDIPALVETWAKFRPTFFGALNTLLAALLGNEAFRALDFSELRLSGAGGSATLQATADRWQEVTGQPILEMYGLSEVCGAATGMPLGKGRFDGTIGVPLPSVLAEVRDAEGHPVPPGTPAELCLKGPIVMRGYYNRPAETAAAIAPDGFFATGDIATMDADGTIRIVDRKKDMILVSGFNVYPTELEDVLAHHPGVADVAVIGVPDPASGEAPMACVVRREPALTAEALIAYARANLAAYKIPRRVEFLDDLPKTPVGKVLRRELRDRFRPASP